MHMETPRRKVKRKLHPSQPTDWRESPQRRRSPVKPVRSGLDQLNAIAIDSNSDSDLDRNVLEILTPTRPSTNIAYVLCLSCLRACCLRFLLGHRIAQESIKERYFWIQTTLVASPKVRGLL